jgi:hypothetical protein
MPGQCSHIGLVGDNRVALGGVMNDDGSLLGILFGSLGGG